MTDPLHEASDRKLEGESLKDSAWTHPHDPDAPLATRLGDMLRGLVSGGEAAKVMGASAALFEAGGKDILSQGTQRVVRTIAERGTSRAIAMVSGPLFEPVAALGARPALAAMSGAKEIARATGKQAAGFAAKEILKGAGKAAGVGFVIDGAVAAIDAVGSVRNGSTDRRTAAKYVAKEATTGAVATGAGVLMGAGLVALTGGIAAPVVFAVGVLGSVGTKRLLRRLVG